MSRNPSEQKLRPCYAPRFRYSLNFRFIIWPSSCKQHPAQQTKALPLTTMHTDFRN